MAREYPARQWGACQSTQQLLKPRAGLLHEQMSKTSPEQTRAELRLPACGQGAAGADPPQGRGAQPCHTPTRSKPRHRAAGAEHGSAPWEQGRAESSAPGAGCRRCLRPGACFPSLNSPDGRSCPVRAASDTAVTFLLPHADCPVLRAGCSQDGASSTSVRSG